MKYLIFSDNHFCETSSILKSIGEKYTPRLDNQIKTLNWLEQLAVDKECDGVICLGDFFDKSTLTDQEITALRDIKWNNLKHYFIVGNHESSVNGLTFNSTNVLKDISKEIISSPTTLYLPDAEICFLPYIIESDRKPIKEYFQEKKRNIRIILSHNDIKGLQMGAFKSTTGFEVSDIDASSDIFLNGHLHNKGLVGNHGLNVGNVTGFSFGEDALKYNHCVYILNTSTLELEEYENPSAFNFYKIEINTKEDLNILNELKDNACLSIKCNSKYINELKQLLENLSTKICAYRIIEVKDIISSDLSNINVTSFSIDHINKFIEFCKSNLDNTEVLNQELSEICK